MTAATRARTLALAVCADLAGTRHADAALAGAARLARRGALAGLWAALFAAVALHHLAAAALATGRRGASWAWPLVARGLPALLRGADAGIGWAANQSRHGWESFRDGRLERLAGRVLGAALERLPACWEGLDRLAGTLRLARAAAAPAALAAWQLVR